MPDHVSNPAEFVRIEAAALEALAQRLDGPLHEVFDRAAALLAKTVRAGHRAIVTGVGKSGLVGRKIAATFRATGTPAHFLHPGEALHGDLGILTPGDVLIALSYSGETDEVLKLLPAVPRIGVTLISFTGSPLSTLASASTYTFDISVEREACAHQLSPTASTTAMLALGDALAIDIMQRLNFQPRDFAELHPGGQLGRRLATARQLMHAGTALPTVPPSAAMPQIMHEMSAKRLGMTTITSNGKLLGVLSDGDLRRLLERNGPHSFHKKAADIMNPRPRTIAPETLAVDALLLLERNKITSLIVTEDGSVETNVLGVLHLHDLWEIAPTATRIPTFLHLEPDEIKTEPDAEPITEAATDSASEPVVGEAETEFPADAATEPSYDSHEAAAHDEAESEHALESASEGANVESVTETIAEPSSSEAHETNPATSSGPFLVHSGSFPDSNSDPVPTSESDSTGHYDPPTDDSQI